MEQKSNREMGMMWFITMSYEVRVKVKVKVRVRS
jgi:hypothetical protein